MSVRIVRTRSGDDIICDLFEISTPDDKDNKPVAYQLNDPYNVWMKDNISPVEDDENLESGEGFIMKISEPEIGFDPYAPLCKYNKLLLRLDEVVAIYETYDEIIEKYKELVDATQGKDLGTPENAEDLNDEEYQDAVDEVSTGISYRTDDGTGGGTVDPD